MVASVTMNGCSLNRAMKKPFADPAAIPTTSATRMARGMGICFWSPVAMIPQSATIDPTERSTPPVRMTMSMPRLMSPLVTIWREMLMRLRDVKNVSEMSELIRIRTTKIPIKTKSDQRSLTISRAFSNRDA